MKSVSVSYRQLRGILIASYVAFCIVSSVLLAMSLWSQYRTSEQAAFRRTATLARALEEHVSRTFALIDVELRELGRDFVQRQLLTPRNTPEVVGLLKESAKRIGIVLSVYVDDADGRGFATSVGTDIRHLRVSSFEHTRKAFEADSDKLYFGPVSRGSVTGELNIPVARPIFDASGRRAGVIGTAINPAYFASFYESLRVGTDTSIRLVRNDGQALATFPASLSWPLDVSRTALFAQYLSKESAGTVDLRSPFDGQERILSFRHVPGFDLYVTVAEAKTAWLAPWKQQAAMAVGVLLMFLATMLALLIFALRELRNHAEGEVTLRQNEIRIRGLLTRLVARHEDERRRFAADLHDVVAQNLSAVGIEIERLRSGPPPQGDPSRENSWNAVGALIARTMASVRQVIADLRPQLLDDYGLSTAIASHAREIERRSALSISVDGKALRRRLAPATELALFRISQEALANAVKHSGATRVSVSLSDTGNTVQLCVEDDGNGIGSAPNGKAGGWGTAFMRERVEALRGTLRIEDTGSGTRVLAEIPDGDSHTAG